MNYLKDVKDQFTEEEMSIEHRIFISWARRIVPMPESVKTETVMLLHGLIYHHQSHVNYVF